MASYEKKYLINSFFYISRNELAFVINKQNPIFNINTNCKLPGNDNF